MRTTGATVATRLIAYGYCDRQRGTFVADNRRQSCSNLWLLETIVGCVSLTGEPRLTSGAGEFLQASVDGSIRRKFGSARLCGKLGRRFFSPSRSVQFKPPFRFLLR